MRGLWGFGWSAQVDDPLMVPTVFLGIIGTQTLFNIRSVLTQGFGCTLASTVGISFVVDSYRSEAGSTLTTLNFAKNLLGTIPISEQFTHDTIIFFA